MSLLPCANNPKGTVGGLRGHFEVLMCQPGPKNCVGWPELAGNEFGLRRLFLVAGPHVRCAKVRLPLPEGNGYVCGLFPRESDRVPVGVIANRGLQLLSRPSLPRYGIVVTDHVFVIGGD